MALFDDRPRTDPTPSTRTEDSYTFPSRADGIVWERLRGQLNSWLWGGRRLTTAALVLACTLLLACGSRHGPPRTVESEVTLTNTLTLKGAGGYSGQNARNYEDSKSTCGAFPRTQVARESGLSASASDVEIAAAVAGAYRSAFRPAVEAGCRAGLREHG
jgi:hypothetical protein